LKPVYCRKCAHLLIVKGEKSVPLCVATARFKGGAIRERLDVVGVAVAHDRNQSNDCGLYTRFSRPKTKALKSWLIERIGAEAGTVDDYALEDEATDVSSHAMPEKPKRKRSVRKHVEAADLHEAQEPAETPNGSENTEVSDGK